jgi:hypothetical protein
VSSIVGARSVSPDVVRPEVHRRRAARIRVAVVRSLLLDLE